MSRSSHIEAGAQLAAALASQITQQPPGRALDAGALADVLTALLGALPALAEMPQASLAIALASAVLRALHAASTTGAGLTPAQRAAMVAGDDAAIAADRAAHPVS